MSTWRTGKCLPEPVGCEFGWSIDGEFSHDIRLFSIRPILEHMAPVKIVGIATLSFRLEDYHCSHLFTMAATEFV